VKKKSDKPVESLLIACLDEGSTPSTSTKLKTMNTEQHEKALKLIDEFINSPEGDAYFKREALKADIQEKRFLRFEEWLMNNDFDKLMYRVILSHDEKWIEKCNHNGFEAYPKNILQFIIDFVVQNGKVVKVKQLKNYFNNQIWEFKGFYFQLIWGQGVIVRIYNKDDLRLLLQL
jgi:hypothetical protein